MGKKDVVNPFENPMVGALTTIHYMAESVVTGRSWRNDKFNDVLETHEIDTVMPPDTGKWETGIEPKGKEWIIVEQYPNREQAEIGHKKWVQKLKENPKLKLTDIYTGE